MRRAEPRRAVAPAASPWPIDAAVRGRGVEGAVSPVLGRADYQRRQTLAQLEKSSADWKKVVEKQTPRWTVAGGMHHKELSMREEGQ